MGEEEVAPVLAGGTSPAMVPYDDGVDDVSRGAMGSRMPLLKIAYAESRHKPEGCAVGQMFNTFTEAYGDHFDVVFMGIHTRQSWMPPYSGSDIFNPAYCQSNDGIQPCSGTDMQPGPCRRRRRKSSGWIEVCPKLQWTENPKTGKSNPPECNTLLSCALYDLGEQIPVIFSAKKYATKLLGQFYDRLQLLAMKSGKVVDGEQIPGIFFVKVRISAKPYKTYFVPNFEIMSERLSDEEAKQVASFAKEIRDMAKGMSTDEITDSVDAEGGADVPF